MKVTSPLHLACRGLALACLLLAATACGDSTEGAAADAGLPDVGGDVVDDDGVPAPLEHPTTGVLARFDLEASRTEAFFAYPWPSDLRTTDDGGPDLGTFPSYAALGTLLRDFQEIAEERVRGASSVQTVYFSFEASLDPESLPADAIEASQPGASAYIIDVDPDSPWYGRRHPAEIFYREEDGVYWEAHTIAIQPLYGFPLRGGGLYAGVVTTSVLSAEGEPVIGPRSFRDIFEGTADPAIQAHFEPLLTAIADHGIAAHTISVATVFTTADPTGDLLSLRAWIHENLATPVAEGLFLASDGYQYDVYEGTYPFIEMQDGTAPFRRFGEGTVTIGPDGEPATQEPVDLRFALAIPPGEMPAAGWPVLMYLHGTGGDYLSFTRNATASEMARRGVAVIGVDQPLHGPRNPTDDDVLDLIVNLSVGNIVGGAGMLTQGAADMMQLTRLMGNGIVIPADLSSTGEEIRTDPDRVAFMGHSQGAQVGPLFLAAEPNVLAGVLSEASGGAALSAIQRKDNDIDIEKILTMALGIDGVTETLEVYHPVLGCIAQPLFDSVDPLSVARHIVLEPRHGRSHNFLMTIGYQDAATPPEGIEALASAAGLPPAEPIYREVTSWTVQGIGPVSLPAAENLPPYQGERSTGALIQFPGRNHYLVSRDVGAQFQVYEFIRTALEGQAFVFPAEDRE